METVRKYSLQQKQVTPIGDYLYIVEGAVRWGLYDLQSEILTVLDHGSGTLLNRLTRMEIEVQEKISFLREYATEIWRQAQRLGITERLFKRDTSIEQDKILSDLLWLEITDVCNQKCLHCYAESGPMQKTLMTLEFAKEVILQGRKEGFHKIQFTGGEPFLHLNLWEMLEFAHSLSYPEIEVYTNLTLVTESDLQRMCRLNIKIATSLLGQNAEVHDTCTQTPGSFDRWYRGIKRSQALGLTYRIGVVRMKQNEEVMAEIEKFLRVEQLLNPDELFNPDDVRPTGRGNYVEVLSTKPLDYELYITVNPVFFYQSQRYNPCWRGEIVVTTDGNVYPCVFSRKLLVGNLHSESLTTVLSLLKETYWKITLDQVNKCRDCELRYACMDCRALSLNAGKGLYGKPIRCNYDAYN